MTKCLPAVSVGRVSRTAAVAIGCLLSVPVPARAGQTAKCVSVQTKCGGVWVTTSCDSTANPCAVAGDGGSAARAAAAAAEQARLERVRLATTAAAKGDTALAQGNFKSAANLYASAITQAPDNPTYRTKRARALRALAAQGGSAMDDLRGAAIDAAKIGSGDDSSLRARNKFDTTGSKPPAQAPAGIEAQSELSALAERMHLGLNLNDPANAAAKNALIKVDYQLKYNREARIKEQWAPDPVALEQRITELNATLPKDAPPVTVEKAEIAFNRYQLDLKVKK